jgi:hypothetical protein
VKFKVIFGLFNAIILIAFLFVFCLPLAAGPFQFTLDFWAKNWYVAVFFLAVLGLLDSYFITNWRLFSLLERENWAGLVTYLHDRIMTKKRLTDQTIRMICNAYMILGQTADIRPIEQFVRRENPRLLARNCIALGLPYILDQEPAAMRRYFEAFVDANGPDQYWVRFFLAFALMSGNDLAAARPLLDDLARQKKDRLVQLAALYLIGSELAAGDLELTTAKTEYHTAFSKQACVKKIEQHKDQIHVVILAKVLLLPACEWLYGSLRPAILPKLAAQEPLSNQISQRPTFQALRSPLKNRTNLTRCYMTFVDRSWNKPSAWKKRAIKLLN